MHLKEKIKFLLNGKSIEELTAKEVKFRGF